MSEPGYVERSREISSADFLDYLAGQGCAVCLAAAYKNSLLSVSFFLGCLYIDTKTD